MEELKIFENEEFGKVRVQLLNGEPMFCLSDVASALEYSNPAKAVIDHCKGVTVLETPTNGGIQRMKFGKDSEVYRLVMKSRCERAEVFQDWVCDDVLPSIRKTGGYLVASDADTPDEIMARALLVAQETLRRRDERIKSLENKTQKLTSEVTYKEDVIVGLVEDIDLATKRQRISQIVKHGVDFTVPDGVGKSRERYSLLYREFELKYHVNLSRRIKSYNSSGKKPKITNKVDYIDKVMNKIPQLYEIACKFFENDVEILKKEWDSAVSK